jgi:hypothetical protein
MRSLRRSIAVSAAFGQQSLCIIPGVAGGLEHRQELVGCLESTSLQRRRSHLGECLERLRRIGAQVDLGAPNRRFTSRIFLADSPLMPGWHL